MVRNDVAYQIANGYDIVSDFQTINSYSNSVPQYWGQPDVDDDVKLFFNSAIELNDSTELYAFGNYAERTVAGGFYYRNVVGNGAGAGQRGGVYKGPLVDAMGMADPNGVPSVLVGDMTGDMSGNCVAGIPLGGAGGVTPDAGILAAVTADPNCFSFIETIPTGFVPRFGGDNEDSSFAVGIRGELNAMGGLSYDLSAVMGSNRTDYFIRNTVNASLGPIHRVTLYLVVRSRPRLSTTLTLLRLSMLVSHRTSTSHLVLNTVKKSLISLQVIPRLTRWVLSRHKASHQARTVSVASPMTHLHHRTVQRFTLTSKLM